MKITLFSVLMSVMWGSLIMVLFSTLRKRNNLIDLCSASGVVVLYVFCAVRMLLPIEINWVRVIPTGHIYNSPDPVLPWTQLP